MPRDGAGGSRVGLLTHPGGASPYLYPNSGLLFSHTASGHAALLLPNICSQSLLKALVTVEFHP